MSHPFTSRHCIDVRGRELHYRRAGDGPPVVLLHASPRSGASMLPLMAMAPAGRSVFAFDTPGCGSSSPLALGRPPTIGDFGDALAATLSAIGIDRAVVYGTHTGAAIAVALAARHPARVAALLLDGLSVFTAAECADYLDGYLPRFTPELDGSHLTRLWSRLRDQSLFFPWHHHRSSARLARPVPTPARLHAAALDLLRAGDAYREPYEAAFRFQPPAWLNRLAMPVFVGARPNDVLIDHLGRLGPAAERPASMRVEMLPADTAAWGGRVWQELADMSAALPAAPPPTSDRLPLVRPGSAFVGQSGAQIHLRASLAGSGRPLVLLHDSPGGARCLDDEARRWSGLRPVLVPDMPAHGDSDSGGLVANDAPSLAAVLDAAVRACGIDEADLQGFGAGSRVAGACAALWPERYRSPPELASSASTAAAPAHPPRADGGHLQAAWLHARDEAVMGPGWARNGTGRHDFGESLDAWRVHRHCVEMLKETAQAADIRAALWRGAQGK